MQLLDYTLGSILEKYSDETPDQDFIVYPDRGLRFSYREFNKRVDCLAKGLLYIGVGVGDKVGIWANNVPDWTTFMFATAKIGAVLVTINTNCKLAELKYLLQNADIHTLCLIDGDRDFVNMIYELVPELKNQPRGSMKTAVFPKLKNIVFIGHEKYRGMYNTAELLLLGEHLDNLELEAVKLQVHEHDVVNIQYTSGTTGLPKGVMLSHHNILNNGYAVGECMKLSSDDRLLLCVPLFHCFGSVLAVCAIISHGASLVITEDFDPLMVLTAIEKEKCTALYGIPSMFIAELNHPMFDQFDLSSLRTGIIAGSECPIETMNQVMTKMHCKDIINVYGLTKSSSAMTATRSHNSLEQRSITVGFELPNIEVKIVNIETADECAEEEQGEVCCRGYNVMKGYYNDDNATRKAIDKDGWLHSGDWGVKTTEGFYRIIGRIKDLIICGGRNINPSDIEKLICQMPQVDAVELIGVPSPKYGEQVGAFIKLRDGESLTEDELQGYCSERIGHYKIPKYIFFVNEFPMTASSKVQKNKLKELIQKLLSEKGIVVD